MGPYFIFIVLFAVFHQGQSQDMTVVPTKNEIFLKEGDSQFLNCSTLGSSNIQKGKTLEWNLPNEKLPVKNYQQIHPMPDSQTKVISNIQIEHFNASYAGLYKCKAQDLSFEIMLTAITESKVEPMFYYGNDTATLSCNITAQGSTSRVITGPIWLKNETEISKLEKKDRYVESVENKTLTIKDTTREDAGLYVARYDIDGEKYDCEVALNAGPKVLDFDKSKNLIQEDTMELQCKVLGYPKAEVTWYKDDVEIKASKEDKRVEQTPLNGYLNARLTIKTVEFEDAGDYTCRAFSQALNMSDSKFITVRVKDKLAALWPFLGIVGEVIVLCTIIFIYEKRRNKQAEQADNDAQEADGATTDNPEGLRHRNTPANNPRA